MIHPPPVRPEEPIAVTPHDGICGGESQQWLSYPTNPHVRFDERGRETERCHTRPKLPRPSSTLPSSDVVGFAELTGDRNPIHLAQHFGPIPTVVSPAAISG